MMVDLVLPLILIFVPAMVMWQLARGRFSGFIGGSVIGIAIGVYTGFVPKWTIVFAVFAIVGILYLTVGGRRG